MKRILAKLALLLALFSGPLIMAGERSPSPDGQKTTAVFNIRFVVDKYEIRPDLYGNAEVLASLHQLLDSLTTSGAGPFSLQIVSSASPEGTETRNETLSDNRYFVIRDYLLEHYPSIDRKDISHRSLGVDWEGLVTLLETSDYAWKDEVIVIIQETPTWVTDNAGRIVDSRKKKLMDFRGGEPWKQMLEDLYPDLRRSMVTIVYDKAPVEEVVEEIPVEKEIPPVVTEPPVVTVPPVVEEEVRKPGFLLYTNLLYDLGLVPNLGTQVYLGRGIALNARWGYGWWKNDPRNLYWRIYGGELTLRKYFSRPVDTGYGLFRSNLGHHIGIFGQVLTYDFELGKEGHIAGVPRKNIFHDPTFGAGLEYGYTLPLGKHFNLDFSIGAGYQGGKVRDYVPSTTSDTEYIIKDTRQRNRFGITRADISLYWLMGFENKNKRER